MFKLDSFCKECFDPHKIIWSCKKHFSEKNWIYLCGNCIRYFKIINGKKEFSKINETAVHRNSFEKIKKIFKKKYPKLRIELKLISLNSKVETF